MKRRYQFPRFLLMAVVLAGLLVSHQSAAQSLDEAIASYEQGDFASVSGGRAHEVALRAQHGDPLVIA